MLIITSRFISAYLCGGRDLIGISEELKKTDPSSLSPLTLAFVGDTVFDLLVRGTLVMQANRPVRKLHPAAAKRVCASAQAQAAQKLSDVLTEQETEIFRRGRNAHTGSIPKSATSAQYHSATGLEALFGWLYLSGKDERISELFSLICEEVY